MPVVSPLGLVHSTARARAPQTFAIVLPAMAAASESRVLQIHVYGKGGDKPTGKGYIARYEQGKDPIGRSALEGAWKQSETDLWIVVARRAATAPVDGGVGVAHPLSPDGHAVARASDIATPRNNSVIALLRDPPGFARVCRRTAKADGPPASMLGWIKPGGVLALINARHVEQPRHRATTPVEYMVIECEFVGVNDLMVHLCLLRARNGDCSHIRALARLS